MEVLVGRVGRAHGVRGEVSVDVRTDDPERRFAAGSVLALSGEPATLTVAAARQHHGRLLVRFEGVTDRAGAEALRGRLLVVDAASAGETGEDEWWDHQLVGLAVESTDGSRLGVVADVLHPPGGDLIAVTLPEGGEALVPFLSAFVPVVDIAGGRLVVEPPAGLLELATPD